MKRCLTINRIALLLFLSIGALQSFAQNYNAYNWYFGSSNLGIRFNRTDNSSMVVSNKAPLGTGGSAVATDRTNANLLFYTDGQNIYDATHSVMPGGSGLGGNPSRNQPVAIAAVPGQVSQYYVFVNGGTGVNYYTVDMNLPGNSAFGAPFLGDVVPGGPTAVPGLTTTSEAMITVAHDNEEDFWLITHTSGSAAYIVTLFTATGASTQITNGMGFITRAANFAYHSETGRIAVSPQESQRDIEIITFDPATGDLAPLEVILNTGMITTGTEAIYDTEWSASGDYLFISIHGDTGAQADVRQYIVGSQSGSSQVTLQSVLPQPNTIFRSYGLQMAPDSLIYHLYQASTGGPFLLGSLSNSDTVASEVNYDPDAFGGAQDFGGMQFPSFATKDSVSLDVTFTYQGECQNAPVSFFPIVTPGADSLIWDFGDGSGVNVWSPVHTYADAGTFDVTVRAFLGGDTASYTLPITLTPFDLQLSLVQDTTACACEYKPPVGTACNGGPFQVTVQAEGGSPQYQWFGPSGLLAGQTTETLVPDSAGYYYVVATMGTCSAYAGVNIKTYDSLDQRANIWHFGQNAGIDFNGLPDNPAAPIQGPLNTPEGASVISDRNGQVIFTTDGQSIFDKEGNDITPPGGLGGENTATQSALIIPVPGDETLFYIFTTQEIYGGGGFQLSYSLFDLKLNNGLGGLAKYNQPLFSPSTERITSNGNWLIAHEYGNNSFRAYQISEIGIGSPVVTAIGSDHSSAVAENGQGYMEIGTPSRIVVALSTPGVSNALEVFDFVDSTGVVTNFRRIDLTNNAGQVYGVEISPSGNKLFATIKGNPSPSGIVEYAFDSLGNPYFKQTVSHNEELGAMQIGPDGQIYVARNNSSELWTFQANEDTTAVTDLTNLQPFGLLAGTQSTLGLPNFTQIISNPTMQPGMTFSGVCLGDSTQFSATGKDPAIDKFDWTFSTGESFADAGPQYNYLFPAPGTYTATVRIYNKCEEVGTFTETIMINDIPPDPSAGVVLCQGSEVLDANPQDLPDFTYLWSTGDTTETITVDAQAFYNVTITDAQGCTRDGEFIAVDNRPQIDFGPDLTICQNTPVAPLDAQNINNTYVWEVNDVPNGNTAQTQSVDTSVPGSFEYKVTVVDIGTPFLCETTDSITYTINESPAFTTTPVPPTSCGTPDGQIQLNIKSPTTSLFTYMVTGPTPTTNQVNQPIGAYTVPNLAAGTYGITVQDQVSGCATINTENINDNAFTVDVARNGLCDPNIQLDVTATVVATSLPVATSVTFRIFDTATGAVIFSGNESDGTFTPATTVPSGTSYVVEVTSGGCTASSAPLAVDQGPTMPDVTFNTANLCIDRSVSAASAGATEFTWISTPAGGPVNPASNPVFLIPGTWDLQVTVDDGAGGLCPTTGNITVTVDGPITPDFTQTTPCADQVTLTATPSGSFTYRWFQNGSQILGGQQLAGITVDGDLYRVDIVSTQSGCVYPSPEKEVEVVGLLDVALTSTPPCEGSEFTLTATPSSLPVTYAWELDGAAIAGATAATLNETRAGLYEVTVTRESCSASDNFNIGLLPITQGYLTDTGIICPDPANPDQSTREIVLDPGPGFVSYEWFLEGQPLNATSQTFTATQAGLYTVDLTNAFGCASSDFIELFEQCEPRIVGPNVFRPGSNVSEGGELTNREFKLFTFFISDEDFHVFIFNRWGEMIFESANRDFRWNGGYNNNVNQLLPPGTYSYLVQYKSSYRPEEGVQEHRGGVVLLR